MRFNMAMSVLSLSLCAGGASVTLWRAPLEFERSDPLWWASTGTVALAWVAVAGALAGLLSKRPGLTLPFALMPGVALLAFGLVGRLSFAQTHSASFAVPFVLGVLWLFTTLRSYRALPPRAQAVGVGVSLLALPVGVVQARARVPLPPATRPALTTLPGESPRDAGTPSEVEAPCGRARLTIKPLLRFKDASDDGFWPLTRSPTTTRAVEPPGLSGPLRNASLEVRQVDERTVHLEAATLVPRVIFSHLNTFTELHLTGLNAPSFRFSPTGLQAFAALPFDDPTGRPAQFATLRPEGTFAVYRCTDAEKGPFIELARGPLASTDPVTLTVLDGEAAQCRITFLDFAAQADVQRSPTAGSNIPVNVLQFGTRGDEPGVLVFVSLAATGIGRGLETVAHAPGVYRNRIHVEGVSP